MGDFVRGARVRPTPAKSVERSPLTLVETTLVMIEIAKRDGIRTEEGFLKLMLRAWRAHERASVGKSGE